MPRISPNLMSQEAGKAVVALKAQDEHQGKGAMRGGVLAQGREMGSGKCILGG